MKLLWLSERYRRDKAVALLLLFSVSTVMPFCYAQEYQYPYTLPGERDPFFPLISERGQILIKEKKELGEFLFQGILYSSEGSQVVINNEIYKEGDVVEGYTIQKIEMYRIILKKGDKEFILKWEG